MGRDKTLDCTLSAKAAAHLVQAERICAFGGTFM